MSTEPIPVDPADSEGRSDVREPDPGDRFEFEMRAEAAADAAAENFYDNDDGPPPPSEWESMAMLTMCRRTSITNRAGFVTDRLAG
ncbi:hypothetical protein ACWDUL_05995 [Nocardia niigatensis]